MSSRSPNAISESSFFVRSRDWTEVLSMLSSRTEARPPWDWVWCSCSVWVEVVLSGIMSSRFVSSS